MYILDEPTTGLHQHDIKKLLEILHTFVSLGNTVVVIEHNLDVIKTADYIIDMGPEGGVKGGNIIAEGNPEQICSSSNSHTAKFLKGILEKDTLTSMMLTTYYFLLSNGNYEREILKWGEATIYLFNIEYTNEWLDNRLIFLDNYFNSMLTNLTEEFILFPNPITSSVFSIKSPHNFVSYSIYNINGKFLKEGVSNNNELINIDNFPGGVYFVKIKSYTGGFTALKLIKQN